MQPHSRALRRAMAVAMLCVAALAPVRGEQAAPLRDLQAAFLLNFARFTEWPNLPADRPLTVCVPQVSALTEALVRATENERVAGRAIRVQAPNPNTQNCHLLFLDDAVLDANKALLDHARAKPVLTISDRRGFARQGGIIELVNDQGRMRFAINVDAAQRARLRISSRLLGLAQVVHDGE